MIKCSFCEAIIENTEKLPEGWGRAKLQVPSVETVDITFCPLHRKEAEEKLDVAFTKAHPLNR
ncbi:unnamed protein product [marine sediment metagenome]|uniref:Uncharacterized protein n=1 Tax=marine sediment metagenome TaxID=412755 RepID=X1PYT7_9ZZZZ